MTQLTPHSLPADVRFTREAAMVPCWSDLKCLVKPRITVMVMLIGGIGFFMAQRQEWAMDFWQTASGISPWLFGGSLLGIGLSCMGASVLNQVMERQTDGLMTRTQDRPLPAGRVHVVSVTALGWGLCFLGPGVLWFVSNGLAAGLSAATILSYCLIYTPMKRRSSLATIVGALPGALPPVMGAAAATGRIPLSAVHLFAIMFLWQLPHFLAIAWLYRKDYARAGIQVLPVEDPSGQSTFRQAVLGAAVLLPLGLMPTLMGVCRQTYFWAAVVLGSLFLISTLWMAFKRDRSSARIAFLTSLVYLPSVFILMLADQVI